MVHQASQCTYKQKYIGTELAEATANEETMFQTAIVPLKLTFGNNDIWLNKKPSSTHFCRPVHLQYRKELPELCKEEMDWLKSQQANLQNYNAEVSSGTINIKFSF